MNPPEERSGTGSENWGVLEASKKFLSIGMQVHLEEEGAIATLQVVSK